MTFSMYFQLQPHHTPQQDAQWRMAWAFSGSCSFF